jgi:hypothetical protein
MPRQQWLAAAAGAWAVEVGLLLFVIFVSAWVRW